MVAAEADNMIYSHGYSYDETINWITEFYDIDTIIDETDTEDWGYEVYIDYDAYNSILDEKINDICYRWFSSTGTPVAMVDYGVDYDDYGYPVAWFVLRNISGRSVTSFKCDYWCYDYYGYPTSGFGYSGGVNDGAFNIWLDNAEVYWLERTLDEANYTNTDFIDDVVITEVTFSDGTTWYR